MQWMESLWFHFFLALTAPFWAFRKVSMYHQVRELVEKEVMIAKGLVGVKQKETACLCEMESLLVEAPLGLPSSKEALLKLHHIQLEELVLARRQALARLFPQGETHDSLRSEVGKGE